MAESDDLRTFIREIMARSDRGFRETRARSEQIAREAAEERRRYFERVDRRINAVIEEERAQRQALLAILDRMDGGGTAGPAG